MKLTEKLLGVAIVLVILLVIYQSVIKPKMNMSPGLNDLTTSLKEDGFFSMTDKEQEEYAEQYKEDKIKKLGGEYNG